VLEQLWKELGIDKVLLGQVKSGHSNPTLKNTDAEKAHNPQ
jgi:hypothetical protein